MNYNFKDKIKKLPKFNNFKQIFKNNLSKLYNSYFKLFKKTRLEFENINIEKKYNDIKD